MKKIKKKIHKTKSWLFEKTVTDNFLANAIKKKNRETQISNIRYERKVIITDHLDTKSLLK